MFKSNIQEMTHYFEEGTLALNIASIILKEFKEEIVWNRELDQAATYIDSTLDTLAVAIHNNKPVNKIMMASYKGHVNHGLQLFNSYLIRVSTDDTYKQDIINTLKG